MAGGDAPRRPRARSLAAGPAPAAEHGRPVRLPRRRLRGARRGPFRGPHVRRTLHLTDVLDEADVRAPGPNHVELQGMDVGGVLETAIFQHPESEVRFSLPEGFTGGTLRLGYGIKTRAWEWMRGAVAFRVGVTPAGGGSDAEPEWLLESTLEPRSRPEHRSWERAVVAVPSGGTLVLRTEAVGSADHAWSGWADPLLEWEEPARAARPTRAAHPNLLLITSDACRADYLSCYGSAEVRTPNLDALAAEGLRFLDARANATTTVGSYASLLTGRVPPSHGAIAD